MADEGKKLQIDDDWKAEAAREKERLEEVAHEPQDFGMPEASFAAIVQLLAMQAMVGLGGFRGPGGQNIPPNLEVAKHHIDLLDVLDRISKNNLDKEDKRLLDTTLHQLRMAYVEAMRMGIPPSAKPGA